MTSTFTIPTLETERMILRAPCEADIAHEIAFYATDAARFVGGPMAPHETWRAIATVLGHWALRGFGFWALEAKDGGAYLGRVGLWFPHGWSEREVAWTLMPDALGRGYATEAAITARAHAYDVLGWDTAVSQIDQANEPSKAVARRLGAHYESIYQDPKWGPVEVWRHPAPDDLADGGMEAYA